MKKLQRLVHDRLSVTYLLLVTSLALHVTDEAINHFLDFYNPLALKVREYLIYFPPTFTFQIWITGLCLAIIILLLLTPLVFKRNSFMLRFAKIFALIMILNGLGHIAGSIWYHKIMAGLATSPLLIFFSACFIFPIHRRKPV
jgi:hypothetical protein